MALPLHDIPRVVRGDTFQIDAEAAIRLAVEAEGLGYARFAAAEGWANDAVVLLTQIAGATSRIGLATGVRLGLEPHAGDDRDGRRRP